MNLKDLNFSYNKEIVSSYFSFDTFLKKTKIDSR